MSPLPLFAAWRARWRCAWGGAACLVCRTWCSEGFCADCLLRFAQPEPRCERCALPVPAGLSCCGACVLAPPPQQRSIAALPYAFSWDGLVQRFKYHAAPELAQPLALRLIAAVSAAGPGAVSLVLPVPVTPGKLRQRGYNQAWELARRVAPALGLAASASVLQRVGEGRSQQGGSREERWRQVREAFTVSPAALTRLRGRHVALVDDVMTTGATVEAAAAALQRAGAAAVHVWVLARTPQTFH